MNKKLRLFIIFGLVAWLFFSATGIVYAKPVETLYPDIYGKFKNPYPVDLQAGKPPPIPVPLPSQEPPISESLFKEQGFCPRCEFSQPHDDLPPDLGTCELETNTLIDFGLPYGVRSVSAIYQYPSDLPFPRNGMPLMAPATGVEYFPEGSTGNLSVCFEVPEGRSGNISFWDISTVPHPETELPTFVTNGVACAVAKHTGVYGLVENLPF